MKKKSWNVQKIGDQNNIGLKYFADIRFGMFLAQIDRQKYNILRKENSAMYSKMA